MEHWQRKTLMQLIGITDVNSTLLAKLRRKKVLSNIDIKGIYSEDGDMEESSKKLFNILLTRRNAYDPLVEALQQTGQTVPASILLEASERATRDESLSLSPLITETYIWKKGDVEAAGTSESQRGCPAEKNARFVKCVDGLQIIINRQEHGITLISTMDSKLTVSKIKDTLNHSKILIKPIGNEGHVTLDQSSVEDPPCQQGSDDAEPLWIFYENSVDSFDSVIKNPFYAIIFSFLKLLENDKLVVVLQCSRKKIDHWLSEISLDNAHVLSDQFSWEQLTAYTQSRLLNQPGTVLAGGLLMPLKELLSSFSNGKNSNFETQLLRGQLLIDILNDKKPAIFRKTIPEAHSKHYIPRTLLKRTCISKSIFQSVLPDEIIFVTEIMKSLNQSDIINDFILSYGPCNGKVDLSMNQKSCKKLTARIILLTHLNHFDQICNNLSNDGTISLHLLVYQNGKFDWKETRGACNMKSLHSNICPESQQEKVHEDKIFEESIWSRNNPVIICDSPGMGKSTLLVNLAKRTEEMTQEKNAFVLFFVMTHFISVVEKKNGCDSSEISLEALEEVIYESASDYQLPKTFFTQSSTTLTALHIFLDGLDEVLAEHLELAFDCLRKIKKHFKFVRLYVTTRTHLLEQLETKLNVLAYTIQPFDADDQVNFLSKYWSGMQLANGEKINDNILLAYIITLLKTLKSKISEKDSEIAGVPLQCFLLAEIFQDEAQKFVNVTTELTEENVRPIIQMISLSELYERAIQIKYEAFQSRYLHAKRKKLSFEPLDNVHVYLATKLLFSDAEWKGRLEGFLLNRNGFSALKQIFNDWNGEFSEYKKGVLPTENLLKVGILQAVGGSRELQFIHRTFAEYFVAKFVASHLQSSRAPKSIDNFIKQTIFMTDSTNVRLSEHCNLLQESYQFRFPGICHFLNLIISPLFASTVKKSRRAGDSSEDFTRIVHACIRDNYQNVLHLYLEKNQNTDVNTKQKRDLLCLATRWDSPEIFNLFCSGDDLLQSCDPTLLEIAVEYGLKRMVIHLLSISTVREAIEWPTESEKLIQLCIVNTKKMNDESVNARLEILKELQKRYPGIISKVFNETGMLPIFELSVHIKIIIALITHKGSEISLKKHGDIDKKIFHVAAENLNAEEHQEFLSAMSIHYHKTIDELGVCTGVKSLVFWNKNDFSINRAISAMSRTPFSSQLENNWQLLALEFGTPLSIKERLMLKKTLGMITTIDTLVEILDEWKSRQKKEATLQKLIKALERTGMTAVAESVKKEFNI